MTNSLKLPKEDFPEKNFDLYGSRLNQNIYGSLKGKIRLKILLNDLNSFLTDDSPSLKVLDAGCGYGQCSSVLAMKGHRLTLCDTSASMITNAKALFNEKQINDATFFHQSIQDHAVDHQSSYDLILCHATIEWTEDPLSVLNIINTMLKPGGYLSLMFFNRDGTVLKSVLRGNFYEKDINFKFGRTKNLTPLNPLNPTTVYQWIGDKNLQIITKSGVRIFYDYCEKNIRDGLTDEQILNCETSFSKHEPFIPIARYIHVLSQKHK